jgi:ABC-type multidrug transport system fused ATPase/permease subunit
MHVLPTLRLMCVQGRHRALRVGSPLRGAQHHGGRVHGQPRAAEPAQRLSDRRPGTLKLAAVLIDRQPQAGLQLYDNRYQLCSLQAPFKMCGLTFGAGRQKRVILNDVSGVLKPVRQQSYPLALLYRCTSACSSAAGCIWLTVACVLQGRFTLLLGSPGSGKSSLLKALSSKLDGSLVTSGKVTYNGHT